MTAESDQSAYLRGKLRLAGVGGDTPLDELCDTIMVLEVDGVPGEQLAKWRSLTDRAAWKIRPPDRDSWGLDPRQQAAMARLASGGVAPPGGKP